MADDTPTVETIVDEMLTLYGVSFTDATSRTVAVETWARQLIAAVRAEKRTTDESYAAFMYAMRCAEDGTTGEVTAPDGDILRNREAAFQHFLRVS